ncbi:uncharacterized protein LOC128020883 [Carassius gibelio]|uniref:uncharacterized protein LOC128020883 n=1 Tax=Carassius gibelio TaxID=101364 RepID=UPI002278D524|nr:uncharacterized protein LOC128020883 [Carassius gibelio]
MSCCTHLRRDVGEEDLGVIAGGTQESSSFVLTKRYRQRERGPLSLASHVESDHGWDGERCGQESERCDVVCGQEQEEEEKHIITCRGARVAAHDGTLSSFILKNIALDKTDDSKTTRGHPVRQTPELFPAADV